MRMSIATLAGPPGGVLVASADAGFRRHVAHTLHSDRWPVQEALGGADALGKLESGSCHLLVLDRRLPDLDADELAQMIEVRFPGIEVVVLDPDTGRPSVRTEASPVTSPVLRALEKGNTAADAETPGGSSDAGLVTTVEPLTGMVGEAPAMQRLYRMARLIAPRNTTVLLTGATGTGKELVAHAIHALSPRAARPFMVVNCAAIPEALLESELFGHVRGAFTGAVQSHGGRIHAAQGGSLFLDEVGELPLGMQAKLLRFLEQKEVQRLGSQDVFRVDVRVIAATNADLARRVSERQFREDLYYRLIAFPLQLPTLAERVTDIIPLAEHFLRECAGKSGVAPPVLSAQAIAMLENHSWPGNVRELQYMTERAMILAEGSPMIQPEHLTFSDAWEHHRPSCPAESFLRKI
jgi:DNA-binding NtrC family response regulator